MAGGKQAETKKIEGKIYSRRDFVVGSGTVLAGGFDVNLAPPQPKMSPGGPPPSAGANPAAKSETAAPRQ